MLAPRPKRRIALLTVPRLVSDMLQRIFSHAAGLQVVAPLWDVPPSPSSGRCPDVNWLIMMPPPQGVTMQQQLDRVACGRCWEMPLSILTISRDGRTVAIWGRSKRGFTIVRGFRNISLQRLLQLLQYAPEASPDYGSSTLH